MSIRHGFTELQFPVTASGQGRESTIGLTAIVDDPITVIAGFITRLTCEEVGP